MAKEEEGRTMNQINLKGNITIGQPEQPVIRQREKSAVRQPEQQALYDVLISPHLLRIKMRLIKVSLDR